MLFVRLTSKRFVCVWWWNALESARDLYSSYFTSHPDGPQTKNKTALYSFHIAFFFFLSAVCVARLTNKKKIQLRNHLIIWTKKKGETSTHFSAICNFFPLSSPARWTEEKKNKAFNWASTEALHSRDESHDDETIARDASATYRFRIECGEEVSWVDWEREERRRKLYRRPVSIIISGGAEHVVPKRPRKNCSIIKNRFFFSGLGN